MFVTYPDVVVLSKIVERDAFDQELLSALEGFPEQIGIKGGVAREMLKVALGITTTHTPEKIADLDVVVFEEPKPTRDERITRRIELANRISGVEPKDLEFLPAGEPDIRCQRDDRQDQRPERIQRASGRFGQRQVPETDHGHGQ